MKRRRSSILTLAVAAAVVALDCSWARNTYLGGPSTFGFGNAPAFDMGVLPMANVLAFVLLASPRRGRCFWGFMAGGVISILIPLFMGWYTPDAVRYWLHPIYVFRRTVWPSGWRYDLFAADAVYFMPQQVLLAFLSGLAAARTASRPVESPPADEADEPIQPRVAGVERSEPPALGV
jgi:hypothetical protein